MGNHHSIKVGRNGGGGGIRHMKNEKIDIKMAVASTYI